MPTRVGRALTAILVAGFVVLGAACSTTLTVSKAQVEQQVKQQLEATGAQGIEAAVCPGDLEGKVGTSMKCTLDLIQGLTQTVTVTVTAVEGTTVKFNIVPDGPPTEETPSTPTGSAPTS
jgi:hypothetical protein